MRDAADRIIYFIGTKNKKNSSNCNISNKVRQIEINFLTVSLIFSEQENQLVHIDQFCQERSRKLRYSFWSKISVVLFVFVGNIGFGADLIQNF